MNKITRLFILGVVTGSALSLGSVAAYQQWVVDDASLSDAPGSFTDLSDRKMMPVSSRKMSRKRTGHLRYRTVVMAAAEQNRIDPDLLLAIIHVESHFNPQAVNADAVGLMQLTRATGERFGATNRRDPKANIEAGARYVRYLLDRFDSDLPTVLAAYNAGEGTILRGRRLPKITRQYVVKVMDKYQEFKLDSPDQEAA